MFNGASAIIKTKIIIIIKIIAFSLSVESLFCLYSTRTEVYILLIFTSRLILLFSYYWTFLIISFLGVQFIDHI